MADVDRRRTRVPRHRASNDYARRDIQSSALPRRASVHPRKKASASCLAARAASTSSAQPSCGALIELLVCGTTSHETQYGPCETPVQNEAAMPFLEQDKPPGC